MLIADLMQPEILIFAPLIVFAAYIVFGISRTLQEKRSRQHVSA